MAVNKKIPQRQCVGCGENKDKKSLIRVIKNGENEILLDDTGKKNGRGAYVCKNGDITAETIVNEPPFSDFEWLDTFGQNFIYVRKYIDVLHNSIVG